MRKFLLYSTILVAFTMSGAAEAACIQPPTCSSLGYTSSKSCTGGVKCPFGNAWNCTAANNTTEITNLKTEVTNLKTQISAINTNITNITNRITNIENNTSSSNQYSDKCIGCEVGMYYDGIKCYTTNEVVNTAIVISGYISAKKEGKCYYEPYRGWSEISYNEWLELKDSEDILNKMGKMCALQSLVHIMGGLKVTNDVIITEKNGVYNAQILFYSDCSYSSHGTSKSSEAGQSLEDFKNSLTVWWFPKTGTF